MKEKDLIDLGFVRTDVSPEKSGEDNPFYYYTWEPEGNSRFCLITDSNDELKDSEWRAHILEMDITFTDRNDVESLIKLVEKNNIKH